jgi:hypothetical protein
VQVSKNGNTFGTFALVELIGNTVKENSTRKGGIVLAAVAATVRVACGLAQRCSENEVHFGYGWRYKWCRERRYCKFFRNYFEMQ